MTEPTQRELLAKEVMTARDLMVILDVTYEGLRSMKKHGSLPEPLVPRTPKGHTPKRLLWSGAVIRQWLFESGVPELTSPPPYTPRHTGRAS